MGLLPKPLFKAGTRAPNSAKSLVAPSKRRSAILTIDEIRRAIEERAPGTWQPAETAAYRRGAQAGSIDANLFGLRLDDAIRLKAADLDVMGELAATPPPSVDWRDDASGCVSPAKDQGQCGACVAFATCAAMESVHCIATGRKVVLSEAHLFHCNGGSCATGWGLTSGLSAARNGVGLEADFAWTSTEECIDIAPAVLIRSYRQRASMKDRKWAVSHGPVLAGMKVFEDFLAYSGGVYRHVLGDHVGNHAVCVVGYDEEGWIVKNSWGPDFGEMGFFRIAYGECGLDDEFLFFSIETGSP
ncbi:hypothetical protein E2493_02945 [Sphingomonas parva]|uniref:Peptidase C1A papain C-terminal domain-containing protein n=1 Tax=Sphingomonas parva TaxID=2555898 RepID=A0A4Y8ZWG5_9SPHN|nr:C1 family peptidase [Sphingomonas parva]TFI59807.1 hypothetical protein E2493_02945 [Sphingomonas parva]